MITSDKLRDVSSRLVTASHCALNASYGRDLVGLEYYSMMLEDVFRVAAILGYKMILADPTPPPEPAADLGYNRPRDYVPPITSKPGFDNRARVRDDSVMDDPDT